MSFEDRQRAIQFNDEFDYLLALLKTLNQIVNDQEISSVDIDHGNAYVSFSIFANFQDLSVGVNCRLETYGDVLPIRLFQLSRVQFEEFLTVCSLNPSVGEVEQWLYQHGVVWINDL